MESNQDVFISHSSVDSKLAYAMCNYLEEKGIRCWIAPRDVQGGTEYAEAIIMGIRSCKIMVVLFNKNANDSIYVKNEVERAFNYETILIPFKVDQTIPSAALELFLGSVHSLDATNGNPEDCFDLLYQNCARVLGKKEGVIEEKPVHAVPISEKTIIDNNAIDHVAPPSLNENNNNNNNNKLPPYSSSSKTMFKGYSSVSFKSTKTKADVIKVVQEQLENMGNVFVSSSGVINVIGSKFQGFGYKTNIEGRVFEIDGDFSVNIDFEAKPETAGWIIAFCFFPFGLAIMIFPSKAKGDMQYKADQALAKIKLILDEK